MKADPRNWKFLKGGGVHHSKNLKFNLTWWGKCPVCPPPLVSALGEGMKISCKEVSKGSRVRFKMFDKKGGLLRKGNIKK